MRPKTRVVNRHTETYDVYIGRGTPFGNPFKIWIDGNRKEVIEMFSVYFHRRIQEDPEFRGLVEGLRGKVIACSCKPNACHGDVIAKWLDE